MIAADRTVGGTVLFPVDVKTRVLKARNADRRLLPPGARRRLHPGVRARRHHADAAAGPGRAQRAGAHAPDRGAAARRGAGAAASERLSDRPQVVRPADRDARGGDVHRRGARIVGAADHVLAAGRRLRHRPANGPRIRHRDRSDARPAERARGQLPRHARGDAHLRHRSPSSRDRGARRQLQAVRARERFRSSATSRRSPPARSRPPSASASSFRRRSWCSGSCSISGSASCRG